MILPPHTTHTLKPLDRSVFGPLSTDNINVCSDFLYENILHSVNKCSFPGLLASAWQYAVSEKNICSGFKECGIYPFNPNAIDPQLMKPSKASDIPVVPIMSHLYMLSFCFWLILCPPSSSRSPCGVYTPLSFSQFHRLKQALYLLRTIPMTMLIPSHSHLNLSHLSQSYPLLPLMIRSFF